MHRCFWLRTLDVVVSSALTGERGGPACLGATIHRMRLAVIALPVLRAVPATDALPPGLATVSSGLTAQRLVFSFSPDGPMVHAQNAGSMLHVATRADHELFGGRNIVLSTGESVLVSPTMTVSRCLVTTLLGAAMSALVGLVISKWVLKVFDLIFICNCLLGYGLLGCYWVRL